MIGCLAVATAIILQITVLIGLNTKCAKCVENVFRVRDQHSINEYLLNINEEHVVRHNSSANLIKKMPKNIKSQCACCELVKSEGERISEQVYHDTKEIPIKPPRRKKLEKKSDVTVEYISTDKTEAITSCDNNRSTVRESSESQIVSYSDSRQSQHNSKRVAPKLVVTHFSESLSNGSNKKLIYEETSYIELPTDSKRIINGESINQDTSVFTSTKVNTTCSDERLSSNIKKIRGYMYCFSKIIQKHCKTFKK